jgi:methylmalonyl-CoA mutase
MVDLLKERGASRIRVFGGGGGVIIPEEIKELEDYGVAKIYSPEDGTRWGLQGIVNHMVERMDFCTIAEGGPDYARLSPENKREVAEALTAVELAKAGEHGVLSEILPKLERGTPPPTVPVVGITGTGGAGKSSLTDELIQRILRDIPEVPVAIVSCDPSRRKTGGALLGDRIRMNAINHPRVYMRSLATRRSQTELPEALPEVLDVLKASGFGLILVETAGIGQGDSRIIDLADLSVYVMTSEYGAASQLEKIDMLDFADLVVINKFEKRGSEDALRDVRKQVQRNREAFETEPECLPVFGTIASKFNDDGVTALYQALLAAVTEKTGVAFGTHMPPCDNRTSTSKTIIVPPERTRYLAEIAESVRAYHERTAEQAAAVRAHWHLSEALKRLRGTDTQDSASDERDHPQSTSGGGNSGGGGPEGSERLKKEVALAEERIEDGTRRVLQEWEEIREKYEGDELCYEVRGCDITRPLSTESLSRQKIPKIVLPRYQDPGEIYR